jgi:hypothetical protein
MRENLVMRYWPLLLLLCLPAAGTEKAAYDSNGRVMAMISDAGDVGIATNFVAVLPNQKRVPLLVRREGGGARRQGMSLAWSAPFTLPDGGRGTIEWKSVEDDAGLTYSSIVTAQSALDLAAIEFVVDLPRKMFAGGSVSAGGAAPVKLARTRTPILFSGETASLHFADQSGTAAFDLRFDKPAQVSVVDRWDAQGRSFQVRTAMLRGFLESGATASLAAAMRLTNHPPAPAPVHLTVDTAEPRFHFDGFGGDYCWNNQSAAAAYTLKNLKLGWARSELKAQQWDRQRGNPGPEIRADLETMRRFQQMGVPYVISIWWLPERFYTDAYEKPRSAHFRIINPEKWDELLDLVGSYLQYAKKEYGVEPDLFSFNEANIGIYVGLTPETHLEAIKRFGAYFRKSGLKTRMLLGDATGPRDTYKFALDAAADPEALQYVGAVGFHSWGGGTPEQYAAWGDLAEWLHLPLLVTELGVDAAAYYSRSYDSYDYGLREARMTQELLEYARPQGTQFWQFTNDYSLVRTRPDGTVEPTARFWLMKQFTDLTPHGSDGLASTSDEEDVLVSAFRKGDTYAVQILNLGAGRTATIEGLPAGAWHVTQTTETAQFQQRPAIQTPSLELPARSLVTLTLGL